MSHSCVSPMSIRLVWSQHRIIWKKKRANTRDLQQLIPILNSQAKVTRKNEWTFQTTTFSGQIQHHLKTKLDQNDPSVNPWEQMISKLVCQLEILKLIAQSMTNFNGKWIWPSSIWNCVFEQVIKHFISNFRMTIITNRKINIRIPKLCYCYTQSINSLLILRPSKIGSNSEIGISS